MSIDLELPPAPIIDMRCKPYQPHGTAIDIFYDKSPSIMYSGPAGTGKSRAALEKMHLLMSKYKGSRALMIRKTRTSLTQSAMVTFEKFVIPDNDTVHWRTGEQEYRYVNGSVIVIGGMDKSIKVMSSEYDYIYVQEATELTEEDWETLTTRCRNGVIPYNQVVGDCNPGPPWHWIKSKAEKGSLKMYNAVHEDNPTLFDPVTKIWTPKGIAYMAVLDALTGVRYQRLRLGLWAASEGMIYTEWNQDIHKVPRFHIPEDWKRYWVIDFGYNNPFVWQAWAEDSDGNLYRFAEIYQTGLLVEDACALIKAWMHEKGEFIPSAVIADHDAEDRATFERHMNTTVTPAVKAVSGGIHLVKSRLKLQDNKKPRMYFLEDSLLEPDPNLMAAMKPYSTEQEFDGYVWEDSQKKETPKKVDDHGMDCVRYISVYTAEYTQSWSLGMGRKR